jgi:hypothetical protein
VWAGCHEVLAAYEQRVGSVWAVRSLSAGRLRAMCDQFVVDVWHSTSSVWAECMVCVCVDRVHVDGEQGSISVWSVSGRVQRAYGQSARSRYAV